MSEDAANPSAQGGSAPAASSPKPTASGVFARIAEEADLPIKVPRWFLVLRVITKSLLYGLLVTWLAFVPVHELGRLVLWIVLGAMWLIILVATVIDIVHRRRARESRLARLSDIAMLLTPLPILINLPGLAVVLLVVGYVLQLRRISAGQVFFFVLFGSLGTVVMGTIALVGAEAQNPNAPLAQPITAAEFTMATLFRLTSVKVGLPLTEEGQVITTVLQIVSALFLGALYGGLLTWAVRDSRSASSKTAARAASVTEARLAYVIKQQQEILRRLDAIAPTSESTQHEDPPRT
jgi:cytochrome c biogenesis factor